ncbi:MAG: DUF262 domain-containing protein [Alkalispirochaeta sp.]
MITTLWAILSDRTVEIPLIQRDYAQGRTDQNTTYIRRNIITAIRNALEHNDPLNFDFVYGHEEKHEDSLRFIPIDGQQRLTTFFLVHWYLAVRDNALHEARPVLQRFVYRTRVSSTDFFEKLLQQSIVLPDSSDESTPLSATIQDQPWFVASWTKDPTVAGILVMLDEIHRQLNGIETTFADLTQNKLLTFHVTNTEGLDLDENTYIRMNARGKLLTEYEHFKAQFEKFLADSGYRGVNDLAHKMDVQWSRVLWPYRNEDNLIDSAFMALFSFVSEINFYLNENLSKAGTFDEFVEERGRDYWKEVYSRETAVERFTAYFDVLVTWKRPADFFREINNPTSYNQPDISVFEGDPDLINRCIQGKRFDVAEKVMLFLVLEYHREQDAVDDLTELSERVRVMRNLLRRVSQDDKYRFGFRSDLRSMDMSRYLQSALTVLSVEKPICEALPAGLTLPGLKNALPHEQEKAALAASGEIDKVFLFRMEDDPRFRGTIWALIRGLETKQISEFYEAFRSVMDVDDQGLVLRALLTRCDGEDYLFHGDYYGWSSAIGNRWYFGHGDRWHGLLAHPGKEGDESGLFRTLRNLLSAVIKGHAEGIDAKDVLIQLIDDWLQENHDFDGWRYYFVKYPSILDSSKNLFAWWDEADNDFEVRTMSSFHARGRHINTYGRAVQKLIRDEDIIWHDESRTYGGEKGPLVLKYNIKLYCEKDGWRISDPNQKARKITDPKIEKHPEKRGQFWLRHTDSEDRIEIALRFVHALYS